jgi:D-alanyl-D-alanine carboxypeptidase
MSHPREAIGVTVRLLAALALLTALAACGSKPAYHARAHRYDPTRYYPPPGPREDPWGPYIREASGRFAFPEPWIRKVMRQESGGQEDVISRAGAMGLMQVMPDTYDGLKGQYGLGDDPFDPHNNILAGTAYLKEMYDRFGAPGFLAAYNAGPNRLDSYLTTGRALPGETINYVAAIAPSLGSQAAMTGPLAGYGRGTSYAARRSSTGCDSDAAYDPTRPCAPGRVVVASLAPTYVARPTPAGCDPDAAYDPTRACAPLRVLPVAVVSLVPNSVYAQAPCDPEAAYDPNRPCRPAPAPAPALTPALALAPPSAPAAFQPPPQQPRFAAMTRPAQERMAQTVAYIPSPPPGRWGIQVGAFANLATAQAAAENARSEVPDLLRTARVELPATTPFGSQVAFRARLSGLSPSDAADACRRLGGRGVACLTVPPPRDVAY